jgi:hypothetical protein
VTSASSSASFLLFIAFVKISFSPFTLSFSVVNCYPIAVSNASRHSGPAAHDANSSSSRIFLSFDAAKS